MEQGPTEQQIIEQAKRQKMPLPERIRNKPELLPGLEFVYSAFWELCTCRDIGMVEGPIPWTAICQYALVHGVNDPDEIDRFSALLKLMDIAYLEYRRKKDKAHENKTSIGKSQNMRVK